MEATELGKPGSCMITLPTQFVVSLHGVLREALKKLPKMSRAEIESEHIQLFSSAIQVTTYSVTSAPPPADSVGELM